MLANWQLLPEPHLNARGFFVTIDHPVTGTYPWESWPWRFARTPARIYRPAPVFGEHTHEILADLGRDAQAVATLYESGVTADVPTGML